MSHKVRFSPRARQDLESLYDYIAEQARPETALAYILRIETFCYALADFPRRGVARDDMRPGLRLIGFERRATIAFHLDDERVIIDRILYGGRDLDAAFTA